MFSYVADGFFRRSTSDTYNGGLHKTIQLNMLDDKFPDLFKLFVYEHTSSFLRFLPENNAVANRISDADVLNICTAFEIAFGLDETEDKEKTVNDMQVPEFKKSMFSRKILFLYQKATNDASESSMQKAIEMIAAFVKLRNDITHTGKWEWGKCGEFSIILVKVLYVSILLRAGVAKETAIKVAERKWGLLKIMDNSNS